jgi:hypothetical protein
MFNGSLEVFDLNLIQTKVKKCFGERVVFDKKMKEHRWRYRKYNIILDEDQQCIDNDSKIVCNNDFEEIRNIIKGFKNEDNHLMVELKDLKMEINEKKAFFNYLKKISFD